MSQAADPPNLDMGRYLSGPERYINFAEDVLDLRLTAQQLELLRAIAEHQRVVIVSGNGVGKSFGVAIAKLAFLCTNLDSTVLGTSGSYSQYVDAVWRPMKQLHRETKQRIPGFPGETYDGGQPTLEIEDNWFCKVVSPRDPGDLEGRHADAILVIIEEADKAYITDEHFDSAGSSVTDQQDRMVAIGNPPDDEADAVYARMESDRWHTIQFSSLDSHNVKVDAGEIDAPRIPGLVDLDMVIEDWETWNGEPWPGLEAARQASDPASPDFREDLDTRWYRRRAGVVPPAGARAFRPFTKADVEAAWNRDPREVTVDPQASAVDVARSGADFTIAASVYGQKLPIRYERNGDDHATQRDHLTTEFEPDPNHAIAVDAIGEGSGLADMLAERFPDVIRFNSGGEAIDSATYRYCWEEALALLGEWLRAGGSIDDRKLYEELLIASRLIEFEERHYASRGTEVICATASKQDVKDRLGRSPDRLDAALMTVWARDSEATALVPTASAKVGGRRGESESRRQFRESTLGQAIQDVNPDAQL